jgi:hypothetical protein
MILTIYIWVNNSEHPDTLKRTYKDLDYEDPFLFLDTISEGLCDRLENNKSIRFITDDGVVIYPSGKVDRIDIYHEQNNKEEENGRS